MTIGIRKTEPKQRFLTNDEMFVREHGTPEQYRKLLALTDKRNAERVREILKAAGSPE